MGSDFLAEEITRRLPLKQELAQSIKSQYGIKLFNVVDDKLKEKIKIILRESLASVFRELELMFNDYYRVGNSEVVKIILSGGAAAIPEIKEQFANYFKKEIEIANPFLDFKKPVELEQELKKNGPFYAIAVGMAKRGLEFNK